MRGDDMSDSLRSMIEKRRDEASAEVAECNRLLAALSVPKGEPVGYAKPARSMVDRAFAKGPAKRVRSPETKARHAATLAAKKAAKLAANGAGAQA
jgi:hypothetical protein